MYTSQKPVVDLNLEDVARQTDGFTGADLENLCNEVANVECNVRLFISKCIIQGGTQRLHPFPLQ